MIRTTENSRKQDLQDRREAAFRKRFRDAMRAPRRYL